jgi:hypothetical protein
MEYDDERRHLGELGGKVAHRCSDCRLNFHARIWAKTRST